MTNYDVYFGTYERTLDSLSLLIEYGKEAKYGEHPRKEVRSFQAEVEQMGVGRWLKNECTNQRWWLGIK